MYRCAKSGMRNWFIPKKSLNTHLHDNPKCVLTQVCVVYVFVYDGITAFIIIQIMYSPLALYAILLTSH